MSQQVRVAAAQAEPRWLDSPAWGMQFVACYRENSMTRDGAEMDRIAAAAEHRIHVVLGFSEHDRGSLYMAQAFIDDGSDIRVHDTRLGRLGGLSCWEHFLRDDGLEIGCYANRYLQLTTDEGLKTNKSFAMSWWRSLEDLETWAQSHPTHVAIFQAALKYLSTMGVDARLRLYHEVTVTETAQQDFRYLGCHDRTGMLRARPS